MTRAQAFLANGAAVLAVVSGVGCCVAGSAHAEGSAQVYGLIDMAVGRYDAQRVVTMGNGATSHIGFRGTESLGAGVSAIFQLENQFNPDDGTVYNPSTFLSGRAIVGLEGEHWRFSVGREFKASHFVEEGADPFGQDGLAGGYGARGGISQANRQPGQIDTPRMNNSVNFALSAERFTLRVQGGFPEADGGVAGGDILYSVSLIYDPTGEFRMGISHADGTHVSDQWTYLSAQYDLGRGTRLFLGYGQGLNAFDQSMKNNLLGISIPLGRTQLKGSFSQTWFNGASIQRRFALGAYYSLSKRTIVYADAVYDSKAGDYVYGPQGWTASDLPVPRSGYDFGVRHSF